VSDVEPRLRGEAPMGRLRGGSANQERYRIVVHGEFGGLLSAAFDDVAVTTGGGKTELMAAVTDSQELYGLLDRLRDHGVEIESVRRVDAPDGPEEATG
jgi:hypothetical protein